MNIIDRNCIIHVRDVLTLLNPVCPNKVLYTSCVSCLLCGFNNKVVFDRHAYNMSQFRKIDLLMVK